MADAAALRDLIGRLELEDGRNRLLDAEIAVAAFETQSTADDLIYAQKTHPDDRCALGTYWRVSRSGRSLREAPQFTSSVDSALTLVPDDWRIASLRQRDPTLAHDTHCVALDPFDQNHPGWGVKHKVVDGRGATLPISLCIAALRARLALMEEPDHA